ncbi:MFS transporter [Nocardia carnea]|uniref:MFS transporter n=1 Tax=Nocardia carnea TaxID=37328 RepID=UPI002456DE75|nr:MFS transporter [Nocardia carnea]
MSSPPVQSERFGVIATLRSTPVTVRYLFAGTMVNQLGAFVTGFLVLYLAQRGYSMSLAGFAATAYSAGAIAGTMAWGEFTQRLGPRATIVTGMIGSAGFLAVIPAIVATGRPPLLLAAVAVAGFAGPSYRPAAAVMLAEHMPAEHRVMAFSMQRIAFNIGAALSPLIAGALIVLDWNLLFWFDALTALGFAVIAARKLPATRPGAPVEPRAAPGPSGARVLLRDRRYHLFLLSMLITAVIWVQIFTTLPLAMTSHGYSVTFYSAILTTGSAVLVLFELKITAYVKYCRPPVAAAVGAGVLALGVTGFALTGHGGAAIVVASLVTVTGLMILGPTTFAYPSTFPPAVRARYIAAHQTVFGLGQTLGPTLGVLVWTTIGAGVWPVCGAFGLLAVAFGWAGMRPPACRPA